MKALLLKKKSWFSYSLDELAANNYSILLVYQDSFVLIHYIYNVE
jgi:hypothetical protein